MLSQNCWGEHFPFMTISALNLEFSHWRGRVWSAAGTALSQWMHSWASACLGSGGIPPNEGVSHTTLERELDSRAMSPNTHYFKRKHWIHCVIGGGSLCSLFKKPPKWCKRWEDCAKSIESLWASRAVGSCRFFFLVSAGGVAKASNDSSLMYLTLVAETSSFI